LIGRILGFFVLEDGLEGGIETVDLVESILIDLLNDGVEGAKEFLSELLCVLCGKRDEKVDGVIARRALEDLLELRRALCDERSFDVKEGHRRPSKQLVVSTETLAVVGRL